MSITDKERQRRHLSPIQPRRPAPLGKGQHSGMWAKAPSLEQEASFWGRRGLSHVLPHIEKRKGSTTEDNTPT